jgi:hypothetical protein
VISDDLRPDSSAPPPPLRWAAFALFRAIVAYSSVYECLPVALGLRLQQENAA